MPTQLNREAYDDKLEGQQLNVGMVGESMQKVHNADYVSIQIPDGNDCDHLVHFKVGKKPAGSLIHQKFVQTPDPTETQK